MPLYLDPAGAPKPSPAVCDRCKMKRYLTDLVSDPNSPGTRVCKPGVHGRPCVDEYDPWRLPARRPEDITLQYPRPDVPLTD